MPRCKFLQRRAAISKLLKRKLFSPNISRARAYVSFQRSLSQKSIAQPSGCFLLRFQAFASVEWLIFAFFEYRPYAGLVMRHRSTCFVLRTLNGFTKRGH